MKVPGETIISEPPLLASICGKLLEELDESIERNMADGILLSGGLDTSALAYLASSKAKLTAFTVALEGAYAPDISYATIVTNRLKLKHVIHYFSKDELYDAIPVVVKVMDSFDPMEVRNSATVYIALREAREGGADIVMTGDGCDELFAGYSFLSILEKELLRSELQKIWRVMRFSSVPLAEALKMKVKLPYLDPEFKRFAMELDAGLKVRSENGRVWGKWILRKAFENLLPQEIVWRVKTPIEGGSGTATLPAFFDSIISDVEFNEKRAQYLERDKVTIRDKEQLFYYETYRSVVGVPGQTVPEGKACPFCNLGVPKTTTYCRRCGAYPI